MKLFVVLALLISVAVCDDFTNVNAINDLAVRLSFNVSAQVDIAKQVELANLQASLTADINGLVQLAGAATAGVVSSIQSQVQAAQANFQLAFTSFVSQVVSIFGKVDGLALLVQQVGDARAAIQLECEDLQQAIQEAAVAVQQSAAAKLQASLTENQKLGQLAGQLTLLISARATNIGVASAEAATNAILADLAQARAEGQVYASFSDQVQNFINNNTNAIAQCRNAVQQRVAALALGITADWASVRLVCQDVAAFKARVTNIVKRIIGLSSIKAFAVLDVQIDDINHSINVSVSISATNQNNDQIKRIFKAVCIAVSGGNADVVILPVPSASGNVQITIQGAAQINLASLGLAVQTYNLSAALEKYQAQVASQLTTINAQVAAFQQQLKTLTQSQLDALTTDIQNAFNAASQAWTTAQQTWNTKLSSFNVWVASAKQTILNTLAAVRDQACQLLELRKSQLDAKMAEMNACVVQFKANLQSLAVDEQTIKSAILTAKGNLTIAVNAGDLNLQAEINATISLLSDMYQQKLSAAAIVQVNLANLQNTLNASITLIQNEEADINVKLQTYKQKLANTIANIKAHLDQQGDQIKARLQELAIALDANIQSLQATFTSLPDSVSVSVSVNFGATVTPDEVKAFISASLKAEFGTDNVTVSVRSSTKRDALQASAVYDASVGPSDGSASGPQSSSAGLTTGAIIGVAIAGLLVVILVVAGVFLKRQKDEDNAYRQMHA